MKHLFLAIALFLVASLTFAQKADKNAIYPTTPYDSTSNFLKEDVARYLGQELWLKRLPKHQQEYGYSNFIINYKKDNDVMNNTKNVYQCCDGYNSKHIELANKRFVVREVLKHPKAGEDAEKYGEIYYFLLQEKESEDLIYYKFKTDSEFTFPFVVTGFLAKQKAEQVDKQFVFTEEAIAEAKAIETGKTIDTSLGLRWKCIDVTVDFDNCELSLIVQNPKGQKTAIPLATLTTSHSPKKLYTADEAASMRKRFGVHNYNRVLQQKIGMNMTPEMCRLSWGEPLEVQEKGANTVWVYAANSLTFRGGKLIQ